MESTVNPQPDDSHIRIAHSIHREMIRRKFTARQRSIIDFILTLSWGCGKPSAIIPRLKDFSLCGVRPNHIRKELQTLSEANVVFWDGAMNAFQLNKYFDQWTIEIVDDFDKKEMDKLVAYNIENKSPNLSKKLPKKGSGYPKKEVEEHPEKGMNFPKEEVETSQKGNFSLPKKGSQIAKLPRNIKAFRPSKESIKAIIKYTTTTTTRDGPVREHSFSHVFQAYSKNFTDGRITEFDAEEFQALFDDYGGEWLLEAMREAFRHNKKNLAYVHGILKGYRERGGLAGDRADQVNNKNPSPAPRMSKQQRELEELERFIEEEKRRESERSSGIISYDQAALSRV